MSEKTSNGVKFILGTKGRMTQVFDEHGTVSAATIVNAGPMAITQIKTAEKDGYEAVQVGFGARKEKNTGKALKGHLKDLSLFRHLREFSSSTKEGSELKRGDAINVSVFVPGDI